MDPRARKAFRAVLAGSLALVLAGVAAPPAYADTGVTEVATYQPEVAPESAQDLVLMAGTTGFAHRRQGHDDPQWTDYATGASHDLPWLAGVADAAVHPAGGDTIAVQTTGSLTVRTPDGDTVSTYDIPAGYEVPGVGADGTRALLAKSPYGATPTDVRLIDLTDGGRTVPVTGLPDGAGLLHLNLVVDGGSRASIAFQVPGQPVGYALADMTTGAATVVPGLHGQGVLIFLSADRYAWLWESGGKDQLAMVSVRDILDGTADPATAPVLPAPNAFNWDSAFAGDHVLAARPVPQRNEQRLDDFPYDGSGATTLLPYITGVPVQAADGGVVVVGGADKAHTAVHRYRADTRGALVESTVLDLPAVAPANAGISLAHGYLRHVESFPQLGGGRQFRVFDHAVTAGEPALRASGGELMPANTVRCQDGVDCVRILDSNGSYGSLQLVDDAGRTRAQGFPSPVGYTLPTGGGRLVDASPHHALVSGGGRLHLVQFGNPDRNVDVPDTGSALWYETWWQAPTTAAAGTVTATDASVQPMQVARTIQVGTCRPTELQVSQHWLYWSCGVSGPAGVYDLSTGRKTPVPAGRALLGDGFLVRHTGGQLVRTDLHAGADPTERLLADLPAGPVTDDRGITWTVDRYGSDVAYVDADDVTHVLATGVAPSDPTAHLEDWNTSFTPRTGARWYAKVDLHRPVDGWRLTITRSATGTTVHTTTGGAVRETLDLSWDGRLPDGSLAPSDEYRWQVSATADGRTVAVPGAAGAVHVLCGARPFRSYDCYGDPSILTVRTDGSHYGEAAWWRAAASGTPVDVNHETWKLGSGSTQVSALVAFGDINDDGYGDLLARTGDGVMYAYLGTGDGGFGSAKKVRLGGGYNAYSSLLSVGDVDGDGYDDLVERDTSGTVWFKGGTGNTALKARVQIATGWNAYTRLAAIGDVNNDGRGDLLAVDRDNVVWRYYGAAGGTYPHRTKIATGWNSYNRIIGVGDLSGDGRNDLIVRDSAGVIWRYDGTADATFPHRVKIATGWNRYAGVY
ncbi:MAG TPA: FG-GAP-like repeat-containing protein [Actinocatenispora sp.]